MLYKLLPSAEWTAAQADGSYPGSAVDRRDGFIHLSGADQVVETAARHFTGQAELTLLAVDPQHLPSGLRWEPARGGALFPHLYGPLPVAAVVAAWAVPPGDVARAVAALLAAAPVPDDGPSPARTRVVDGSDPGGTRVAPADPAHRRNGQQ